MMASRGMGDISPSKMPDGKKKARRDNTNFTQFAKGGEVWDKARPKSLGKPKKMSPAKKAMAKASAKAAGRPYPNLIDHMKASKK
jgi:hypothetical protein